MAKRNQINKTEKYKVVSWMPGSTADEGFQLETNTQFEGHPALTIRDPRSPSMGYRSLFLSESFDGESFLFPSCFGPFCFLMILMEKQKKNFRRREKR